MYIAISIGNSDDKLSQKEWSRFCEDVQTLLSKVGQIHFYGTPPAWTPWQNAMWLVELQLGTYGLIENELNNLRYKYRQESIFILKGTGNFIKGK